MLCFQLNWGHLEGTNEQFDKGCRRAGIDPAWFVKVVAEINLYMPDDWRMTRTKNNFRIQVVSPEHNVSLVGSGFRTGGNSILSIIDSIQMKNFFDVIDGQFEKVTHSTRAGKRPPAAPPNVYYFQPAPDNSFSPLYARQYEKILKPESGREANDQYHRIHPLSKEGLDLAHHRWVRWHDTGDVEFVEGVDPRYHGKDYWIIGSLKAQPRRASLRSYRRHYAGIMDHFKVNPPSLPESLHIPYETEYKLLIPGSPEDGEALFELLQDKGTYDEIGFSIVRVGPVETQKDTYFDDDQFSLHALGASLRVRRKTKDNVLLNLKKRGPRIDRYSKEGSYDRIEEEAVITSSQEKALRAGKAINAFPFRLLAYIAPRLGKLSPRLVLSNSRSVISLENRNDQQVRLCLDSVCYKTDRPSAVFREVEIEGKGTSGKQLSDLARFLERQLGLIPSRQSKYERGVSLLRTSRRPAVPQMVIIDTDCGVDDALALILAMRSPELQVKAVTTVSGNVHVGQVITNVCRVFEALRVDPAPPVARGADRALVKARGDAKSVHGSDGLGDCIPDPLVRPLDPRPGWQVICDLARACPKQITLITLGPMTNLALAIRNDAAGVRCLKDVVSMGGVFFDVGNVAPDAEFNVWADPTAAREVTRFCRDSCLLTPIDAEGNPVTLPKEPKPEDFTSVNGFSDREDKGVLPLTFVGLDVTHKVILRKRFLDRAAEAYPHNSLLEFVRSISRKFMDFYNRNEGLEGCYLHDPLAVAYVINPGFLDVEKHIIRVETSGSFTSGMIFPDDRPTTNWAWRNPAEKVIGVARQVEAEAFEEFFIERALGLG